MHTFQAKRDLEEHQKQKAVRKALKAADGSAAPAASTTPASGSSCSLAIDIEQLRKVELLVQQLQAPPADAAAAAAGRHGPKLPPPPQVKGASGAAGSKQQAVKQSTQAAAASQLTELLRDNDACCVYFRECGGLKAAAALVRAHLLLTADTGRKVEGRITGACRCSWQRLAAGCRVGTGSSERDVTVMDVLSIA